MPLLPQPRTDTFIGTTELDGDLSSQALTIGNGLDGTVFTQTSGDVSVEGAVRILDRAVYELIDGSLTASRLELSAQSFPRLQILVEDGASAPGPVEPTMQQRGGEVTISGDETQSVDFSFSVPTK